MMIFLRRTLRSRGSALVITLSMLVLLSICVLAFMSLVRFERQSGVVDVSRGQADLLAKGFGNVVLDDFISEIAAGSTNVGTSSSPIYIANTNASASGVTNANMLPQRVLADSNMYSNTNFDRLYKQSTALPFFSGSTFSGNGLTRASAVSSSSLSRNSRLLSANFWNAPRFIPGGFTNANQLPSWIYISKYGRNDVGDLNPVAWSADLAKQTNASYVIGRVAYNVYEVAGAMDINVAGGPSAVSKKTLLSSLAQAQLADIPGFGTADTLIDWRNPVSGSSASSYLAFAATNGLRGGFLSMTNGDRRFVTRQDLIASAVHNPAGGGFDTNSLPYLTHFSRGLDRPYKQPTTNAAPSSYNSTARPTNLNLNPLKAVTSTAIDVSPSKRLPAGTPVLYRKFPLRRLALITDDAVNTSNTSDIYKYFGLKRSASSSSWVYDHGADNRIKTLTEVAAEGREPDFFETLQAAIMTGTLGGSGGHNGTTDSFNMPRKALDENLYLHVLQIGANIIDQYDADDFPTEIQIKDAGGLNVTVIGVENLPYISEVMTFYYRPVRGNPNRTLSTGWLQFELWNPHQNAASATGHHLRVAMEQGTFTFRVTNPSSYDITQDTAAGYGAGWVKGPEVIAPQVNFSTTPSYLEFVNGSGLQEPKVLGPDSARGWPVLDPGSSTTTAGNIVDDDPTPLTPRDTVSYTVSFAGIKLGQVDAPDDRVDGIKDFKCYGADAYKEDSSTLEKSSIAYNGIRIVAGTKITAQLQIFANGRWRTYQRLSNFITGSFPFFRGYHPYMSGMLPRNSGGIFAGVNKLGVASDPRTPRFGLLDADSPGPGGSMRTSVSDQMSIPGGGTGFSGAGWTAIRPSGSARWPIGYLSSNLRDNPYVSTAVSSGFGIYYADPDGVVRRGDGDERSVIAESNRSFPSVVGNTQDRPVVLNRPFESVAELGYVFRDQPWKTLDFSTKDSGDGALLDFFSIEEAPLDHDNLPLHAGVLNPNTASLPVLRAILDGAISRELASTGISSSKAEDIAGGMRVALGKSLMDSLAGLPKLVDDDTNGPGPKASLWRKTEKEALVRALASVSDVNVWNVCVDIVAQSGRFPAGATKLEDFMVQGEARYWIFASIDRSTGKIIDVQSELVNE